MEKTSVMLSVICPKEVFESDYYFLAYNFPVVNADSIEIALQSSIFFYADVMLFDCPGSGKSYQDLLKKIDETSPGIRIVASWDSSALADTLTVSRLFYCFKKPVTEKQLVSVIESAVDADHTYEKRSEPRLSIEIPVELCRNGETISGNTVNLSLNGFQVQLADQDLGDDISISRLYFKSEEGEIQKVELPVARKYSRRENGGEKLMAGFSFEKADEELKCEIYRVLTAL